MYELWNFYIKNVENNTFNIDKWNRLIELIGCFEEGKVSPQMSHLQAANKH